MSTEEEEANIMKLAKHRDRIIPIYHKAVSSVYLLGNQSKSRLLFFSKWPSQGSL